ncbi:cation:proton antiporter [Natronomonas sp. EA1]|uniref:cation:proton antiporter n=1 Tax=Natronomonas sp. EA1 TaxID=3421655 RepID=UPI003EBCCCF0
MASVGGSVLLEAGIVFAVLALGGAIALRARQSVIPAYILAGILVGPFGAGLVETREFIVLLRELGIVFLLFFIGLEFNLDRLLAARKRVVRAGGADLLINGTVGLVVGVVLGFTLFESLFVAGIVTISSSAVITKTLIDLGWIADPEAEAILTVLIVEDVAVAVYLAVLAAVALGGSPEGSAISLAISIAVIVALTVLAFKGTGILERLLDTDSDEQFLLRIVGMAVLVSGLALAAGVSEAVAAFFLGAAIGGTEQAHRVERVITSERDLYAAVFFLAIGLDTNPGLLPAVALPLAVLVVATTASKLASGYMGGRAYGLDTRRSTRVALGLVARAEFSLVIAALAVQAGVDSRIVALAVGYVLVMSVLGTVLMRHSDPVERWVTRRTEARG